jgi:topoisomerase-4 subunit B
MDETNNLTNGYGENDIVTLQGLAHVRHRPGMYIGKLGDGSSADDGIYVLLKEIIDNSIDEFRMKYGNTINITIDNDMVTVRDFGRGIPQGKIVDSVSIMNTSGKFEDKGYVKSVGLNGVGIKAVNALSTSFTAISYRDGMAKRVDFSEGKLVTEYPLETTKEKNGTFIQFSPDRATQIFGNYSYKMEYVEKMLRNYSYLNPGLTINFNGQKFLSKNGLLDLLTENNTAEALYPIVHIKGEDIEIAFTHTDQYSEEYFSFVNGQHTIQGGTHQSAFREAIGKTIKEFYAKKGESVKGLFIPYGIFGIAFCLLVIVLNVVA